MTINLRNEILVLLLALVSGFAYLYVGKDIAHHYAGVMLLLQLPALVYLHQKTRYERTLASLENIGVITK